MASGDAATVVVGAARPVFAEDIGNAAFPDVPYEGPLRSLCRPAFSSTDPSVFVCGTEDHDGDPAANRLVFGKIDFETKHTMVLDDGKPALWTSSIPAPVTDAQWAFGEYAVGALGDRLGLIHITSSDAVRLSCEVFVLPSSHSDVVREVAVHPTNRLNVLSASCDGTVCITNLSLVRCGCVHTLPVWC